MKPFRNLGLITLGLLLIAVVVFFLQSLDFGLLKNFAPKYETVRRQTFEQSESYNEGMLRDLQNIRAEYLTAQTDAERSALRATAIHRFAAYPVEQMPADLRAFYAQLQN